MRILAKTAQKHMHLLVHHGMVSNQRVEFRFLAAVGQFAIQDKVADIHEVALLRELIDGQAGHRADNSNLPDHDAEWWEAYVAQLRQAAEDAREADSSTI